MDERNLRDEELAGVTGGVGESEFSRIADSYAWAYGCASCPYRYIFSSRGMCMEVYNELLANYSMEKPIGERCPRRR